MITLLNLFFPLMLSLLTQQTPAPSPAPTLAGRPYVPHCPCDIGHKSW